MRLRMQSYQPIKRDQSGFSTIEALLVVLVVAVLAVIGFVVYQRHKPSSAKNSAATSQTQTKTQPAQTTTQYLTIKEWGVKLPLSSAISNADYVVAKGSSSGAGGQPDKVWLGLTSNTSASCNPANNDAGGRGAIGAIIRVLPTDTDPVSGQLLTQKYPNGVTIGGYYYLYQSWATNNPCASNSTLQSIDSAFAAAAKGIVATDPNYLVIKEWGIKIKLADADKITYTLGGTPNGSSPNTDGIVSWATLKLNSSVNTSDKCRLLGFEVDQLTAGTGAPKIGKYNYGFSGTYDPCGDSTVDPMRAKITSTELVDSAITAE
jgi:type II secretory pathway pseudopilin PulG